MAVENIISFEQTAEVARQRLHANKAKPIIAAIRVRLMATLPCLLQDLFEHLDDELYRLANKSTKDMLQTQYFEVMRELRKVREVLERHYLQDQLSAYDDFWLSSLDEILATPTSMKECLPEVDAALEEVLAVNAIISKASNRFHRELFVLNTRFAKLISVDSESLIKQPLAPECFAEGFKKALSVWKSDMPVRLLVYKLFDRYVMSFIGGLYDDVNDIFVEAGILPEALQQTRRNPVAASVQRARDPQKEVSASGLKLTADPLNILNNLLSSRPSNNKSPENSTWTVADFQEHRSQQGTYGRIEAMVSRVLGEFSQDVSVFERLNNELSTVQEREKRGAEVAEVAEKSVGQIEHGHEQLKLAKQKVSDLLEKVLGNCQAPDCIVPDAIKNVFNEGWHDVLLLAYLRDGKENPAWIKAVDVAEKLVWSVQPKYEAIERKNLLKIIPELLEQVREGLMTISFDQQRSAELLKQIQSCHILALRGQREKSKQEDKIEQQKNIEPNVEKAIATGQEELKVFDDEFQQKVNQLKIGDWLEWQEKGDTWLRAKLSWKSEATGNCVFVSNKGIKAAEVSSSVIAARLRTGRAKLLSNVKKPLMDRALDAMMEALENTDNSQLSSN